MEEALPLNHCENRLANRYVTFRGRFALLGWVFLSFVLLPLDLPRAHANRAPEVEDDEAAEDELAMSSFVTTIGMEGVYYLRDGGAVLTARPHHAEAPMTMRIANIEPRGDQSLYEIRYTGRFSGDFDLRYYLIRTDGRSPTELKPMRVTVRALLPPDHEGELEAIADYPMVRPVRYVLLLVIVGTVWAIPVLWSLLRRLARNPAAIANPEGSRTSSPLQSQEPLLTQEES